VSRAVVTQAGLKFFRGSKPYKWFVKNKRRLFGYVVKAKPKPAPVPAPSNVTMYDDVNVSLIPVSAEAVAGYVDGRWPTYAQIVKKFPHAKYHLSIAVFASDNAEVLDVETGDATIAQAVDWVKRQHARGNARPDVYTAASWGENLINALSKAGFVYGRDYRWWSAHYTYQPHLCGPKCGFGLTHIAHATQWTDKVAGKSLDESLCAADFFS
jgi:hypothetical protein